MVLKEEASQTLIEDDCWVKGRVCKSEPKKRRFCVTYTIPKDDGSGEEEIERETEWLPEHLWETEVERLWDTDSSDSSDDGGDRSDAPSEASDAPTDRTAGTGASRTTIISDAIEEAREARKKAAEATRKVAGLVRERSSPTSGDNPSKRAAPDKGTPAAKSEETKQL